jgi:hypothetical protein
MVVMVGAIVNGFKGRVRRATLLTLPALWY